MPMPMAGSMETARRSSTTRPRRAAIAICVALVPGCSGVQDQEAAREAARKADEIVGPVVVSAAASLTDAFLEIEVALEARHPGLDVVLNLAGSSSLATQLLEGAPVDVFASASEMLMDRIVDAGEIGGEPVTFAANRLQIAVPPGNPAGVRGLEDLGDASLRVGLCAEEVPCGARAREVLARAGVRAAPDTHEPNVRALLTKIALGELDVGLTYGTDVAAAAATVQGIDVPDETSATARYPIAVLRSAPNPEGAAAFVRFVLSDAGRAILTRHGFGAP